MAKKKKEYKHLSEEEISELESLSKEALQNKLQGVVALAIENRRLEKEDPDVIAAKEALALAREGYKETAACCNEKMAVISRLLEEKG